MNLMPRNICGCLLKHTELSEGWGRISTGRDHPALESGDRSGAVVESQRDGSLGSSGGGQRFLFLGGKLCCLVGSGGCDVTDIGNGGGQSVESMWQKAWKAAIRLWAFMCEFHRVSGKCKKFHLLYYKGITTKSFCTFRVYSNDPWSLLSV